jgi:hypothetical protein
LVNRAALPLFLFQKLAIHSGRDRSQAIAFPFKEYCMRAPTDQQGRLQKCRLCGNNEISILSIFQLLDRKALIHRTSFEPRKAPMRNRRIS